MANSDKDPLLVYSHTLAKFQFIEEGIRIYLKAAYALTKAKLQGVISVNLSVESLQSKSLSASLHEFRKFNGNSSLIDCISKLIPKRNHLAHTALYKLYFHLEEGRDLQQELQEAVQVGNQAAGCIELLHKEIELIEGLCQKAGIMNLE